MSEKNPVYSVRVDVDAAVGFISKMFDYKIDRNTGNPIPLELGTSTFIGWSKPEVPADFSIGLIVGPSGTGKSLLLSSFGQEENIRWNKSKAIVSHFPNGQEAADRLMSVGFNDVRSMIRPYHVLSTGEQFRADLARRIKDGAVIDEFTSVVDRNVAKSTSKRVRKFVDKNGIKGVVFATCHTDVIEWLRPDWYFDTTDGSLHDGRLLRWPTIEVAVYPVKRSIWSRFAVHHYLDHKLASSARCFIATAKFNGVESLVGFASSMPLPSGTLKKAWREHRTVILPDFQGLGIGPRVSDEVARVHKREGKRYYSKTSHPRFGDYRDLHPELWKPTSKYDPAKRKAGLGFGNPSRKNATATNEATNKQYNMINGFGGDGRTSMYSHEFIGEV